MARKPRTVLEQCVAARGVHRGALTAAHIAQYAMATRALGRIPGAETYADYWSVDERTAWRHRQGIREVYGDKWREVVQLVADELGDQLSPKSARTVEVPARLVPA